MRRIAVLLALLVLAAAPAQARHVGPADWSKNPNQVPGIFDEQFNLYLEAETETSGPFLSLNDSAAGPAQHHKLAADPTSGVTSAATTFQNGAPSQKMEMSVRGMLPRTYFLNLSRPIIGTIFFSQSAYNAASATPGTDVTYLRAELFQGTTRVGGYEDAFPPVAYAMAWPTFSMPIWPEVHKLEAGQPLMLRITRSGGVSDFLVGTGGDIQSFFDIRYTSVDPLAGALYLEGRKIVAYDGSKEGLDAAESFATTTTFQEAPDGTLWRIPSHADPPSRSSDALILLPIGGFALALRRPRIRTALAATLLVGLAGCMGSGAPSGAAPDATETTGPSSTADVRFEPRPGLETPGIGAVAGHIEDDLGFAIQGAHISFLGTNLFGQSNASGDFEFPNVTRGSYVMRLDATGYGSLEQPIDVRAGELTRVNITMAPEGAATKPSGHRPHLHDDWAGQTTAVLGDLTVSFAACADRDHAGTHAGCRVAVPLERSLPVPPGTGLVQVTLTWTAAATAPRELALEAATAVNHYSWIGHGAPGQPAKEGGFSVSNQFYVARPSGQLFGVAIFPNEADPGHQKFTDWQMWLLPSNADLAMPHRVPVSTETSVSVKVVAHKMVVPYEPAHPDRWQNRSEIVLWNHVQRGPAPDTSATTTFPSFSYAYRMDDRNEFLVPAGTAEIHGYLSWTPGPSTLTTWKIMYRPADKRLAAFGDYPEATMQGSGNNHTFVIKPTASEVDQIYQRRSLWWFLIEDQDERVNSSPRTTWYFTAVAVRDPAWTPD